MANPGEWIGFAELVQRVQAAGLNRRARVLRQYYKDGLISYRQAVRGGRVEFNWKTVERELRAMDTHSAAAADLAAMPEPTDLVAAIEGLRAEVRALREQMFAGEQRKAG